MNKIPCSHFLDSEIAADEVGGTGPKDSGDE